MSYKIVKYPDGTSYVNWDKIKINTTFKINSYEDLWHLNQLLDSLKNNRMGGIVDIVIPNLIDAQADRRFGKKESSGLKLVCELLNQYKNKFKIFHPHNPEVVEALLDNVEIVDNSNYIEQVLDKIRPINNLVWLSPDAGAYKWIIKTADKVRFRNEIYSASKSRKYIDGESKLIQIVDRQNFEGKDILIVDDICVRGGTFVGLAKILRTRNIGKLYLAVSHMTIKALNPELFELYDEVFTTNSKYDNYFISNKKGEPREPKNLNVIKLF